MPTWFELLRNAHIAGGTLVLLLGLAQLILPKFGRRHRLMGLAYLYLMWFVGISAMATCVYRMSIHLEENIGALFLFIIAVFSIYLVTSGFRLARLKNNPARMFDTVMCIGGVITGLGLLGLAAWLFTVDYTSLAIISMVFGGIQCWSGVEDYNYFARGKRHKVYGKMSWLFSHLGRMIGSYIAATTAFLVNAVHVGPMVLRWLAPTVVGSFVIVGFVRHFRKKYGFKGVYNAKVQRRDEE
ncbi:MAG: hypothetical protein SH856_04395 [Flavobacteriales bacterium]|nr:hypothetical protein [Flavobacteriales bacterium]